MGHDDPAALPETSAEEAKKNLRLMLAAHYGADIIFGKSILEMTDAEVKLLVDAKEEIERRNAQCLAENALPVLPPVEEQLKTLASRLGISVEDLRTTRFIALGQGFSCKDGIVVRENTPEQGGGFSAWANFDELDKARPSIPATGTGDTELEAVRSLAALFADFVRGHGKRIEQLEEFTRVPVPVTSEGYLSLARMPGSETGAVD